MEVLLLFDVAKEEKEKYINMSEIKRQIRRAKGYSNEASPCKGKSACKRQ